LLERQAVPCVADEHELGAWDRSGEIAGGLRRHDAIGRAVQHDARHAERREATLDEWRLFHQCSLFDEKRPPVAPVHLAIALGYERPHGREAMGPTNDRLRATPLRQASRCPRCAPDGHFTGPQYAIAEDRECEKPVHPGEGTGDAHRADQDKSTDQVGPRQRQLESYSSSERVPDDDHAISRLGTHSPLCQHAREGFGVTGERRRWPRM
jgi:hypothetical protein